jgi:hypothetical protein
MLPKVTDTRKTTTSLKINCWESGIETYASVDLPECNIPIIGSALSENAARDNLKKELLRRAGEAVLADHYSRRLFIGTDQGNVFIIEWRYGQMGYTICGGADRKSNCRVSSDWTYEQAVEAAKHHIMTGGFGEIVWEHS